uniref:Uncharacterized protein n=1 Tax=Trieres chinensis TaxID=1514140 RepID=A0A7S2EDN4_TRICV
MTADASTPPPPEDPTAWVLDNSVAPFLLMSTPSIRYMCMFGYAMFHGNKIFSGLPASSSTAFKFVSYVMACVGGGIIVPILLNGLPVALANDALVLAMLSAFGIHLYFPILREVFKLSDLLKATFVVLFETFRCGVVIGLTTAAAAKIPPSVFPIPVFGPIFCGAIAGCGGAFLPFNKGLEPIKGGLASPMLSALVVAACFHIFMSTPLSDGIESAKEKAHVHAAAFLVMVGLVNALGLNAPDTKPKVTAAKKNV